MVLNRHLSAAGLCLVSTLAMIGACVPERPAVRRAERPRHVTVAYVIDRDDASPTTAMPASVRTRVDGLLVERNLLPAAVPSAVAATLGERRRTQHRLEHLATADGDLLLLIEAHPRFYSQLSGRYRWTVQVRATLARREGLDAPLTADYELAVFLDFAHQREDDALEAAGPGLERELGRLLDDFVVGLGTSGEQATTAGPEVPSESAVDPVVPTAVPSPVPMPVIPQPREPTPGGDDLEGDGSDPQVAAPQDDAIYFVMIDRFANGLRENDGTIDRTDPNAFHGGDLRGISAHLDYLHDLGIRTVWLSPFTRALTRPFYGHGAFHGYWVERLDQIEPRFGTNRDLNQLGVALDRRGMRMLADIVLNHVGYEAPLLTEHPEWFHGRGAIEDFNDPEQLVTGDVHGLPDLDQSREDVYRYLLTASLTWADRPAVAGFRLDAVRHIEPQFWRRYNGDVQRRQGPNFMLLAEQLDGNPAAIAPLLRDDGFTHAFDFPLYFATKDVFCDDAPPARIAAVLFEDRRYPAPERLVTLLDNHDLPRIMTACHGDIDRVKRALLFQLTSRGIPSLTYGTEVGLAGATEAESRRDMRFDSGHQLYRWIAQTLALRRAHPVFARGRSLLLAADDEHLALLRLDRREAALVVLNAGRSPLAIDLEETLGPDLEIQLLDDGRLRPAQRTGQVTVAARQVGVAIVRSPAGLDGALAAIRRQENQRLAITFRVTNPPRLRGDEQLRLVGSGDELGGWQARRGLPFRAAAGGGLDATVSLPLHGAFAYKLVVSRPRGDARWESGDNRHLYVDRQLASQATELSFRSDGSRRSG